MPATYEPIATTTLSTAASSITFSSIPATYTDLRLAFALKMDSTGSAGMIFNSDTGTNYSFTDLWGTGAAVNTARSTSDSKLWFNTASTISSTQPRLIAIDIFSYAGSTNKTTLYEYNGDNNGSGNVMRTAGLWRNTAAITSIQLNTTTNFGTGTTATLYGILKA
jgi:hypothetical protein